MLLFELFQILAPASLSLPATLFVHLIHSLVWA